MTTFNPNTEVNNEETYLEERNEFTMENRGRAYSQVDHNEQSELIESKTVASQFQHGPGLALSQYY